MAWLLILGLENSANPDTNTGSAPCPDLSSQCKCVLKPSKPVPANANSPTRQPSHSSRQKRPAPVDNMEELRRELRQQRKRDMEELGSLIARSNQSLLDGFSRIINQVAQSFPSHFQSSHQGHPSSVPTPPPASTSPPAFGPPAPPPQPGPSQSPAPATNHLTTNHR